MKGVLYGKGASRARVFLKEVCILIERERLEKGCLLGERVTLGREAGSWERGRLLGKRVALEKEGGSWERGWLLGERVAPGKEGGT